jgi:hypothetical protein
MLSNFTSSDEFGRRSRFQNDRFTHLFKPSDWTRILILSDITAGRSNNWIASNRGDGREFVRSFRRQLASANPESTFQQTNPIGGLKKASAEIYARVEEMTRTNRHLSCVAIAQATIDSSDQFSRSPTTVHRIRRNRGFSFLLPIATFSLTLVQIARRLGFAVHHTNERTDWAKPFSRTRVHLFSATDDGSVGSAARSALT